MRSFKAANY